MVGDPNWPPKCPCCNPSQTFQIPSTFDMLTKRELFAMIAMHGLSSRTYGDASSIPSVAVQMADDLIDELNK